MNPPFGDEPPLEEEPPPWEAAPSSTTPALEADPVLVAQRVEEVRTQLSEHAQVIEDLIGTLEELTKSPPKSAPSPFSWTHADAEQRLQLWRAVGQWVQWHNAHYPSSGLRILPCWYRHPTVVVELTALMEAWRVAYTGHQSPTFDAVQYLQHYLHPIMQRVQQASWGFKSCSGTRHELNDSTPAGPGFKFSDPDFVTFVDEEVGGHTKQEPPLDPMEVPEPDAATEVTAGGDATS